jgi:hypothetical protein
MRQTSSGEGCACEGDEAGEWAGEWAGGWRGAGGQWDRGL